jgi:hypothetical protein
MVISLVTLIACGGGVLVVDGDTGSVDTTPDTGADDTGADDTGADDTGADDTGNTTDTEDTTPPEPIADTSVWSSELIFNYDTWGDDGDCVDEVVHESSYAPSKVELAALAVECPACSTFYWTVPDTAQICGWLDLPTEELRGLVLGDDWAQVYRFSGSLEDGFSGDLLDSAGTFDGWTVTFSAVLSIWWTDLNVEGTVTFPETYPDDATQDSE